MIIRTATTNDAIEATELLKQFCQESLDEYGMNIALASVQRTAKGCAATSLVLEHEGKIVGLLAGAITMNPIDNQRIWQEIVWYVSKPYRRHGVKLLRTMEIKVKQEWGCAGMMMVCMGNSMTKKLDAYYQREGYVPLETHYFKRLGG